VQNDDKARPGPPNAGRGLDELSRCQWQAEHHHCVQAVYIDAVGHHRRRGDNMQARAKIWLGMLKALQN
jgi:hypothetical protein